MWAVTHLKIYFWSASGVYSPDVVLKVLRACKICDDKRLFEPTNLYFHCSILPEWHALTLELWTVLSFANKLRLKAFVKTFLKKKTIIFSYSHKVRTELIPSPPTYNSKYGYLNLESYSNISYYTRLLPPIPEDCPLPMGTKGETCTTCTHRQRCSRGHL